MTATPIDSATWTGREPPRIVAPFAYKLTPLSMAVVHSAHIEPERTFGGLRVFVHRPRVVKRSLRERFCTRPWRPWIATKVIGPVIPPDECWRVGDQLHMGERAFDLLKKEPAR